VALAGINDDDGVLDVLGSVIAALQNRAPFEAEANRLRDIVADLTDAASNIRNVGENCEDNPERLAEVRQRRQSLRELRRKYGESLAEVMAYLDESSQRLDELQSFEVRVEALEKQRVDVVKPQLRSPRCVKGLPRPSGRPLLVTSPSWRWSARSLTLRSGEMTQPTR
jgi:DNA repair protein RecN (Recombination protein N)